MNILNVYATSDKQKHPCAYPEWDKKRIDTTFYADLFVAWKGGGLNAIRETYKNCFDNYKNNVKYMVELTGALNHLLWDSYNTVGDCEISREFDKLWSECDSYCCNTFKDDELEFYTMVLD